MRGRNDTNTLSSIRYVSGVTFDVTIKPMPAGEDGIQGGESAEVVQDERPRRGGGSEEEGARRSAAKTLEARRTGDTRA